MPAGSKKKKGDGKKKKGVCEPSPGYYPEIEDFTWPSPHSDSEVEKEKDKNQKFWDEMDLCLTEIALEEQKKNSNLEFKDGDIKGEGPCVHDCELYEQIGLICKLCNVVCTEIGDILPPLVKEGGYKISMEEDIPKVNEPLHIDPSIFANLPSEISEPKPYKNIWASIPNLEPKLHNHQRNAFEFIWKNLTGNNLENMKPSNKTKGGCVISHSPGSGKTLTVISFLTSYLAVYPNSRPLVLTPKSAVHTWEKEFQKWEVEIPAFIIHRRPTKGRNRMMDSLKMIKSWHENPSVLVMTYPSFLSLAKENSKDDYSKLMSNVLLNNPELLVLDEGHNPRNTKSKLRKLLMKVKTKLRILLSGTVFQNNFKEYFNTLCLARPRFVKDLINELDPKKGGKKIKKGKRKGKNEEKKARNLFVDKIGERIESSDGKEREQGINLLKQLTFNFIDTFDGQNLENLPGLETYTIFLKSTKTQEKILNKLQNSFKHGTRYPIEIELLVSIGSIHPWLVTTSKCSKDFFTKKELKEIEKYSTYSWSGSKTGFVIDIIIKSLLKKEKVLIFCHNLAPLNLLVNLIESAFAWTKGEEILVLLGEQDLAVRSETIDKFNGDKEGKRKVLLASTNACAEGINLTAASRVVLLDSEWNHSKTKQAIARAFRLGQVKKVYVYLLLGAETWEEGKYRSNMRKAWMSKMVVLGRSLEEEKRERVEEGEIEDEMLREIVQEDGKRTVKMVVKHE
ncbi:hypothetical protein LUZ60_013097 [Juncus effusus]|nr:hypothetical protein LUZ60_013097 [Juncus effusus]